MRVTKRVESGSCCCSKRNGRLDWGKWNVASRADAARGHWEDNERSKGRQSGSHGLFYTFFNKISARYVNRVIYVEKILEAYKTAKLVLAKTASHCHPFKTRLYSHARIFLTYWVWKKWYCLLIFILALYVQIELFRWCSLCGLFAKLHLNWGTCKMHCKHMSPTMSGKLWLRLVAVNKRVPCCNSKCAMQQMTVLRYREIRVMEWWWQN